MDTTVDLGEKKRELPEEEPSILINGLLLQQYSDDDSTMEKLEKSRKTYNAATVCESTCVAPLLIRKENMVYHLGGRPKEMEPWDKAEEMWFAVHCHIQDEMINVMQQERKDTEVWVSSIRLGPFGEEKELMRLMMEQNPNYAPPQSSTRRIKPMNPKIQDLEMYQREGMVQASHMLRFKVPWDIEKMGYASERFKSFIWRCTFGDQAPIPRGKIASVGVEANNYKRVIYNYNVEAIPLGSYRRWLIERTMLIVHAQLEMRKRGAVLGLKSMMFNDLLEWSTIKIILSFFTPKICWWLM